MGRVVPITTHISRQSSLEPLMKTKGCYLQEGFRLGKEEEEWVKTFLDSWAQCSVACKINLEKQDCFLA